MTALGWPRAAALFSAVMAVLLVGTWLVLLGAGAYDTELANETASTLSLLAAEFLTAGLLLVGAAGLARSRGWGGRVELAGLGMLLYTTVNTVGVSLEEGIVPVAVFMALVAASTAFLIARAPHGLTL